MNLYKINILQMGNTMLLQTLLISFSLVFLNIPSAYGWGYQAHTTICRIAQARLKKPAAAAVRQLLPSYAKNDLGMLCPWADKVKFLYPWSSSYHFINVPDRLCNFNFNRDCKDAKGLKIPCLVGAISNYTTLLGTYPSTKDNLTEALLFLSHYIADIHQPLHVGYASDRGGNTIKVRWYTRKSNLHTVWDTDMIKTGKKGSTIDVFTKNLQQKINRQWAKQVTGWGSCTTSACANRFATESIQASCQWAYKGVQTNDTLKDEYFKTRFPVVEMRLAQAGVRLAAALNQIFK